MFEGVKLGYIFYLLNTLLFDLQTLKAFLGSMIKNNRGHVISIASIAGYGASPQLVDYCASKFGAVGLHEALSLELYGYAKGIKTTSVCPWFIKTGMFEGAKSR